MDNGMETVVEAMEASEMVPVKGSNGLIKTAVAFGVGLITGVVLPKGIKMAYGLFKKDKLDDDVFEDLEDETETQDNKE